MAQPALSGQIRQLEEMLGAPLFVRRARGVQLTDAGERLLVDAHGILEHVERAEAQVKQVATRGAQTLRIGFIPSSAHTLLPTLLDAIRRRGGEVSLQTREMITADQFEALDARLIDVAISRPLEVPDTCQARAEMADPYCLAIPSGHPLARQTGPLSLAQAANEDFVTFTRFTSPAYFDRAVALCVDARFSPRLRHEASGFGNALQLVALGLGVCIVPASLVLICPPGVVFRLLKKVRRSDRLVLLAPAKNVHPQVLNVSGPVRLAMQKLQRSIAAKVKA